MKYNWLLLFFLFQNEAHSTIPATKTATQQAATKLIFAACSTRVIEEGSSFVFMLAVLLCTTCATTSCRDALLSVSV